MPPAWTGTGRRWRRSCSCKCSRNRNYTRPAHRRPPGIVGVWPRPLRARQVASIIARCPHGRVPLVRREHTGLPGSPDHIPPLGVAKARFSNILFSIRTRRRPPMTEDGLQRVRAARERGLAKAREFFEGLPLEQIEALRVRADEISEGCCPPIEREEIGTTYEKN